MMLFTFAGMNALPGGLPTPAEDSDACLWQASFFYCNDPPPDCAFCSCDIVEVADPCEGPDAPDICCNLDLDCNGGAYSATIHGGSCPCCGMVCAVGCSYHTVCVNPGTESAYCDPVWDGSTWENCLGAAFAFDLWIYREQTTLDIVLWLRKRHAGVSVGSDYVIIPGPVVDCYGIDETLSIGGGDPSGCCGGGSIRIEGV